jgi:adenylate kinase
MKEKKEQKRDWLPDTVKQNLGKVSEESSPQESRREEEASTYHREEEASTYHREEEPSNYSDSYADSYSDYSSSSKSAVPHGILIFGPPGVGKGTQCELIVKKTNLVHISTGDILREAVKSGSELGQQAQVIMNAGGLVSDDIMIGLIKERLNQPDVVERGFILDGFPRTRDQGEALLSLNLDLTAMLLLDVDDDTVVERICGRRLDPETGTIYHLTFDPPPEDIADRLTQRSDDCEEVVRSRLQKYQDNLSSVESLFSHIIKRIDAKGDKYAVFREVELYL